MLNVTVDRKTWARGRDSRLREHDGKMCCLGFAMLAAGATKIEIQNKKVPSHCLVSQEVKEKCYTLHNNVQEFLSLNDNPDITDNYRERKIREHGKYRGIKFSFRG